jgi:hypothetical protein
MSLDRRKPFAPLHPNANARPTDSALAPRSSATSSAESLYSTASSMPQRRRKLSAAEDVAARVRARWAALEALERASGAPAQISNPADTMITATNTTNTAAAAPNSTSTPAIRSGARIRIDSNAHDNPEWRQRQWAEIDKDREKEKENDRSMSMSMAMQVDGHEKPLPPRPAPLALALRLNPSHGPLSAPARFPAAPTMPTAMAITPMMVDTREENQNGTTPRGDDDTGALASAGAGGEPSESTLRMTPTSLTCYETTESQRQGLQRRPTRPRALTPPQVRRRPSITDELEEAVRS